MKREPGFYWVKYEGEWTIAEYQRGNYWRVFCARVKDADSIFDAIHETRLIPPDTRKRRF